MCAVRSNSTVVEAVKIGEMAKYMLCANAVRDLKYHVLWCTEYHYISLNIDTR
jgi:hypothetical protein